MNVMEPLRIMLGSTSVGKVQRPVCERFGSVLQRPMVSSRTPKITPSNPLKSKSVRVCRVLCASCVELIFYWIDFLWRPITYLHEIKTPKHCTGIAQVVSSNPVENTWIFHLSIRDNLLNCPVKCEDHFSLSSFKNRLTQCCTRSHW